MLLLPANFVRLCIHVYVAVNLFIVPAFLSSSYLTLSVFPRIKRDLQIERSAQAATIGPEKMDYVDYTMSDFKQKLFEVENILRTVNTDEKYIPRADKWRVPSSDEMSSFNKYKNFIDCDEVFPNIIVGNLYAAKSKEFLKDVGVTHVLNCAHNRISTDVRLDQDYYKGYKIKYKGLELDDIPSENIFRYFDEAAEFIDDALCQGGKVLVHCLAGVSRSATITIAYLMKRHHMRLEDAIKVIKQNRRIFPNEGFLKQLVELDFQLSKNDSVSQPPQLPNVNH